VPTLVFDIAGAVLASATQGMEDVEDIVCIETQFIDSKQVISGYFLLIPDNVSLRAIFQAIKLKG
jgi:hypothetical protein